MTASRRPTPGKQLVGSQDRRAYQQFLAECQAQPREIIGFAGAGVSLDQGYPTWRKLLANIHVKALRYARRPTAGQTEWQRIVDAENLVDLAVRAGEYEEVLGVARFRRILKVAFARRRLLKSPTARAVVSLPFRYVFTTNYDSTLERTYGSLRRSTRIVRVVDWSNRSQVDKLMSSWGKSEGRWYVHLHGTVLRPSGMILTERDYAARYLRSDEATRALLALLSFRTVAFFGYSFDDLDLLQVLRQTQAVRGTSSRHFAFVGLSRTQWRDAQRRRTEYKAKYGVEAIFYKVSPKGGHAALASLLDEVNGRIAATQRRKSKPVSARDALKRLEQRIAVGLKDPLVADDPNKGLFGGLEVAGDRMLAARVTPFRHPMDRNVNLAVSATPGKAPLQGYVTFYLHPTFPEHMWRQRIKVNNRGFARLRFWAYGAFTVGAIVEDARVSLELDLATVKGAPKEFVLG